MRSARTRKDFSIESILADNKCTITENDQFRGNDKTENCGHQYSCDLRVNESQKDSANLNVDCMKERQLECTNKDRNNESKSRNFKPDVYEHSISDNGNKKLTKRFKNKSEILDVVQNARKLEWLQCTRYKPPKIHRKTVINKNRRKPSAHPRIPFSTFQLCFLEQKFRNSAYVSREDLSKISNILSLPSNRIKIWFQNRRARERRTFCTNAQ